MKKIFLIFIAILFFTGNILNAQNDSRNFTAIFDSLFHRVNKNEITTGILYDRVVPFSNLTNYNSRVSSFVDTANAMIFIQAYSEINRATLNNATTFSYPQQNLANLISQNDDNINTNIAFIHCNFNIIDSAIAKTKLRISDDSLIMDPGRMTTSLYQEREAFLFSPLTNNMIPNKVTFVINDRLIFDNTHNPIKTLQVDFDDGFGYRNISIGSSININYKKGVHIIKVNAIFLDRSTLTAYSKIISYDDDAKLGSGWNYIDKFQGTNSIYAKIDIVDYEGHYARNNGNVWIYYANADKKLRKPILIVDGFDPGNKRQFETYTGSSSSGKSIWDQFYYNGTQNHLGRHFLEQLGYDLVVLDFPDGGGYIERNAMVCIEVINLINKKLQESGSKEKIVVVGPSMGGQITRFALAYMEKHPQDINCNYGKHNCRLWVSFDSPHKGANISYGAQALINYFANQLGNHSAQDVWNNTLNCVASKQMLIHHKVGSSRLYFERYYNRLENIGYPVNLRKIAVTNGSLSGTSNGNPASVGLELTYPYVLFNLYANVRLYPNPGYTTEIFKTIWVILGIPVVIKELLTAPNSAMCGIDGAPGSTYNTFDQIVESLPSGSFTSVNLRKHTFMPIISTLDLSNDIGLCSNFYSRDFVAEGKTPFASYKGVVNQNTQHVFFNNDIASYLINEVETYITPIDTISVCELKNISLHLPSNISPYTAVNWECSSNLQIISGQGSKNIVIKCLNVSEDTWVKAIPQNLTYNKELSKYKFISKQQNNNYLPAQSCEITQNTTWSGNIYLSENVTIYDGVSLKISGTVYANPTVSITVNPGAVLTVDGGIITNSCNGEMWQGIKISGNWTSLKQGKLNVIRGAIIANAKCAVESDPSLNKICINVENSEFLNNKQAFNLSSINPVHLNAAFANSRFTVNENFINNNANFKEHVVLQNVSGISFGNCNFNNNNNANSTSAILAVNSSFKVDAICTLLEEVGQVCPEEYLHKSNFNGFECAIKAAGTGSANSIQIENGVFLNNICGIEINAINNVSILKNNFTVGRQNSSEQSTGIKILNSTGFKIEENQIVENVVSQAVKTGILVHNSGANNNEIYKNDLTQLNIGLVFTGQNRAANSFTGLQFLCNRFYFNRNVDAYVYAQPNTAYQSIREYQGGQVINSNLTSFPAGNQFSTIAVTNILLSTPHSVFYQFANGSSFAVPTYSGNFILTPVNDIAYCPSKINNGMIIFPDSLIIPIGKSMQLYENTLSEYNNNKNHEIEKKLADYSYIKDDIINNYIHLLMIDSVINFDKVNAILSDRGSIDDIISISEYYINKFEYQKALFVIDNSLSIKTISNTDKQQIDDLKKYIYYLNNLHSDKKSIYYLSKEEIVKLQDFSSSLTGRAKILCDNILYYIYGIGNDTDNYIISLDIDKVSLELNIDNNLTTSHYVTVAPNPATDYCKFELSLPQANSKATLKIFDISGKEIYVSSFSTRQKEVVWNCKSAFSGSYFYVVYSNNRKMASGTIIIK